jgi:hypothetical protein
MFHDCPMKKCCTVAHVLPIESYWTGNVIESQICVRKPNGVILRKPKGPVQIGREKYYCQKRVRKPNGVILRKPQGPVKLGIRLLKWDLPVVREL